MLIASFVIELNFSFCFSPWQSVLQKIFLFNIDDQKFSIAQVLNVPHSTGAKFFVADRVYLN